MKLYNALQLHRARNAFEPLSKLAELHRYTVSTAAAFCKERGRISFHIDSI